MTKEISRKAFLKKAATLLVAGALGTGLLAGCSANGQSGAGSQAASSGAGAASGDSVITVGASPTPHAEILKVIADNLEQQGYALEIKEYNDYVLPNTALQDGDLDANYFQHITYLNDFNAEKGTDLVSAAEVHFEPLGLYSQKVSSIADLPDGAKVAVPNDTTNEARALLLLEQEGLIKLKEGAGLTATKIDIVENPKNLVIQEVEAAQVPRTLAEVDLAAINGNYALNAGLDVDSAIAKESSEDEAAKAYVNVLAVKAGNENSDKTKALVNALLSPEVAEYIASTYNGAVVATF
ncbi:MULTISPECIES: MetQ/NlpA family ABC transporter substrate-binding protein [unclassified Adlercreutzia]|uniref:MetQ/NlpA family ABC transporter substrate-binding protein n=1 Tax=unclassified Adlercreutzia TaxID=2636013 RepID=UPI001553BF9F|nr:MULTISPECIES: MetQ/NlpA family ABC transporter substrate-binding protein [unclassified Adlercreutzia]